MQCTNKGTDAKEDEVDVIFVYLDGVCVEAIWGGLGFMQSSKLQGLGQSGKSIARPAAKTDLQLKI